MHRTLHIGLLSLVLASLLWSLPAAAAPWIEADWAGKEPSFPRGSLYYHTNEYPTSPVVFRTVIEVGQDPIAWAGLTMRASGQAYVLLNGELVYSPSRRRGVGPAANQPIAVEFADRLRRGVNVLVVSTPRPAQVDTTPAAQNEPAASVGFSLEGGIGYAGGQVQRFTSATEGWRVQKFTPLTILRDLDAMGADFNDSGWFAVKTGDGQEMKISDAALATAIKAQAEKRLKQWDADGKYRLEMLTSRGYAVVDWEPYGFGGPGRLPEWLRQIADKQLARTDLELGESYQAAEAICRYVAMADQATNMKLQAAGMDALGQTDRAEMMSRFTDRMAQSAEQMAEALKAGNFSEVLAARRMGRRGSFGGRRRQGPPTNRLNTVLDNKFGWFDNGRVMDNHPDYWDLKLDGAADVYTSPLAPASLITADGKEISLSGWDSHKPMKVYYRKKPNCGPVRAWAVIDGQVKLLKPNANGVVYNLADNGELSENWVALINDITAGGQMPIELVFLSKPETITFTQGKNGTAKVTVEFAEPKGRLLILRPLQEWSGFLGTSDVFMPREGDDTQVSSGARRFTSVMRFWSKALLKYPISFAEAYVPDPEDKWALLVSDAYEYMDLTDAWGTEPTMLAPLPPLATYGLLTNYPGLKPLGEAKTLGSRGIWGDLVGVTGTNVVSYRVPMDPIKRFGGFTAYCFGSTDIGQPGSLTEILSIKATGANSFRPQHNSAGEPAMKTAQWCVDNGIQNVFNTDEKWVGDIVGHYATLAEKCKDYPADLIAYDLLNEPETRKPRPYSAIIKKVIAAIREHDKTHIIYVETMPPWGPGAAPFPIGAFETLEPIDDPLIVYSFHDYEFRLGQIESLRERGRSQGVARWPNALADIRDIYDRWIPAFRYSILNRAPIHLGEFGGFEQVEGQDVYSNPASISLMMDYFRIFDEFGWHWQYYANRGTTRIGGDGAMYESKVQEAVRRYFARGTMNANRGG